MWSLEYGRKHIVYFYLVFPTLNTEPATQGCSGSPTDMNRKKYYSEGFPNPYSFSWITHSLILCILVSFLIVAKEKNGTWRREKKKTKNQANPHKLYFITLHQPLCPPYRLHVHSQTPCSSEVLRFTSFKNFTAAL